MIRQLGHLNFSTDRPQEMVDFYNKGLGLPIAFTLDDAQGSAFGWYVDCGNRTFIEIFDRVRAAKQWGWPEEPLKWGNQYRHFCLEVAGLEEFRRTLISRGVKVKDITMGMDGSRQAWLSDPDGNSIELMEYTAISMQLGGPGTVAAVRK